ncbi:hypothetical protein LWI29_011992 [Acer saccharum]|uniref:Uncharacterized protein n=1 Tax=Acer saccharum TaxID=4024 RepID=A0AA39SGT2_ACESA|nr:hypothetical protein LWI29_011992 [Acer saccharum]
MGLPKKSWAGPPISVLIKLFKAAEEKERKNVRRELVAVLIESSLSLSLKIKKQYHLLLRKPTPPSPTIHSQTTTTTSTDSSSTSSSTFSFSASSSPSLTRPSSPPTPTLSSKVAPPSTASPPSSPPSSPSSSSSSPSPSSSPKPPPSSLSLPISSSPSLPHYSSSSTPVSSTSASVQTSDLQAKCDTISSRVSALSSLLCLALACNPKLFVADVALGGSLCLQGLWELQTGLTLYVEAFIPEGCHKLLVVVKGVEGSTQCDLEESKLRAMSILDLLFLVHVMFVFVILMVTYAAIAKTVAGRRLGSYEALPTTSTDSNSHIQMKALTGTQA